MRYLAVDARRSIPGRKYFISPIAIGHSRRFAAGGDIRIELTRDQISRCPTAPQANLRSSTEVLGCGIEARDGVIGTTFDLVVDDETWDITDVLVNSHDWLRGSMLLISPEVIERIKLCVYRNPVHFLDVDVRFANGGHQDVSIRRRINPGQCTRDIDLAGDDRNIASVSMLYEETSWRRGAHATVRVFAE